MENHLITIEQSAVITERFDEIGRELDRRVELARGMVVSEENYKDAKKIRADVGKEAAAYAEDFKKIKGNALAPWRKIEDAYHAKVRAETESIDGMENAAEVMVEYRKTLDFAGSVAAVNRRAEAKREQEERLARQRAAREEEKRHAREIEEAVAMPTVRKVEDPAPVKEYSATFTVRATREKLKSLVEFMRASDIIFEQIRED